MELIDNEEILSVKAVADGVKIKIVVQMQYPYLNARFRIDNETYKDVTNIIEPFDRTVHVFLVCAKVFDKRQKLVLYCAEPDDDAELFCELSCEIELKDAGQLAEEYDNKIEIIITTEKSVADGVIFKKLECADKFGKPVIMFALFAKSDKASFCVGTPDDGLNAVNCRATVETEALAAISHGKNVVAAVNADFFDMFGNSAPSGLCVKDGQVIANENSERPFFGLRNDGTPVIARLNDGKCALGELKQAVGGREIVLKDGEIAELSLLEPFSFIRHPRTAVGITSDNTVIYLVIDGRIPDYSNGASLSDVANVMKMLGARNAINLDGGGSSILILRSGSGFDVQNNPADLFRPTKRLIREGYNSILITV